MYSCHVSLLLLLLPSKKIIYLSDSAIFLGFHRSLQASFKKSSEVPDLWLSIGLVIVFHRHLSSSKVASNDFSDKNRRSLAQCLKISQKVSFFQLCELRLLLYHFSRENSYLINHDYFFCISFDLKFFKLLEAKYFLMFWMPTQEVKL